MSTRSTPWEQGTPNWADLSTHDLAATTTFYSAVMGWEMQDKGPDFGHYTICTKNDLAAAGIGPAMSDSQPSVWTTYLAAEDVDKTLAAITSSGGTVLAPPMEVGDQGRMAIAADPTGAVFGLWQAKAMVGAQIVNEAGGICWNDHNSNDPEAARRFYAAVFGFTYTAMEGGQDYSTIDGTGPGGTVGGIGQLDPSSSGIPAHWAVYFAVDDADAACAAATTHGGRVLEPATDTPFGRMATLCGPEGETFKIMGISPETAAQL